MFYLLSYDVQDDRQRGQICKYLKAQGYHIQKSVFILDCPQPDQALAAYQQVVALTTEDARVFMTPMCRHCCDKIMAQGIPVPFTDNLWLY